MQDSGERDGMRKSRFRSLLSLACLVGLGCLGGGQSFATETFTLTGVTGLSLAGVFTSPYLGGLGTVDLSSNPKLPDMNVICDDFGDNSYLPEQWQVNVTTLATVESESSPSALLKWAGADSGTNGAATAVDGQTGWTLNQKVAYNAAAYLAIEILNANTATQSCVTNCQTLDKNQEDLSFALWELFASNAGTGQITTNNPTGNANWASTAHAGDNVVGTLSSGHSADLTSATNDVEAAIAAVKAPNFAGFTGTVDIYSYAVGASPVPMCGDALQTTCTDTPPQEFISVSGGTQIRVPEGSSFDSIGVYLLGGGLALFCFGRRRIFSVR